MKTHRSTLARNRAWMSTIALVAAMHLGGSALAQANSRPPERLTYQGFIAGSDGVALGNAAPKNYDVVFRIFDSEGSTTPLWGEQQTVTVDKGYFSVLLGEGAAVSGIPNAGVALSSLFNSATASERWVSFTVKGIGTGGADAEILPRVRMMSLPYAFLANRALNANAADTATTATTATTALSASKLIQSSGADLLTTSGNQMLLSGALGVAGNNVIEFGQGIAGKGTHDGKMGYGTFSGDSLDIVGAGNSQGNRKVRFYSDGGVTSDGPFTAPRINTENIYINGVGGVFFGNGRAKHYPLNGLIAYNSIDGADQLVIHGGGLNEASRRVIMFSDAGFRVLGPQSVRGRLGIEGAQVMEWGQGLPKEIDSGMIGYGTWTPNELDVTGAGLSVATRRINFHAAGGVRFHGFVGVNSTAYAAFPLDVSGYVVSGGVWGISLRVSHSMLSNSYQTSSDRRIKDVLGLSSSQKDMEALRRIRVTEYRMKERAPGEERPIKGVIAQDLQEALPDAVTTVSNVIPDILKDAQGIESGMGGKSVVIRLAEPHGIAVGDRVRIRVDDQVQDVAALEVPDTKTFTYAMSGGVPKKVRVIGREVKDFLSVDYQQIYMTAVSALQEVDRQVQGLHKEVARIAELERKAARVDAMERDIAELRKLVAAMAAPGAKGKESAAVGTTQAGPAVADAR